jgi:tRNA-2-methylthio-N6-dimethylallyladenosine synthase
MYSYSERPEHWQEEKWKMTPEETKARRLQEIVDLQQKHGFAQRIHWTNGKFW